MLTRNNRTQTATGLYNRKARRHSGPAYWPSPMRRHSPLGPGYSAAGALMAAGVAPGLLAGVLRAVYRAALASPGTPLASIVQAQAARFT